ncbi:MAG: nitroreductase [Brevundimonas sp.]
MSPYAPVGAPLPAPEPSEAYLKRLSNRRSTPAQTIGAPGPGEDQIARIISVAARTPDHGKLAPWRFVILGGAAKARIAAELEPMAPDPKSVAVLAKLRASPVCVMVVATPVQGHKIPTWEQELSAGAVCMNLLHAADALGFGANWITDWYGYEPAATALFGVQSGERIAGFIHLGTPVAPPLERDRPDLSALISRLD